MPVFAGSFFLLRRPVCPATTTIPAYILTSGSPTSSLLLFFHKHIIGTTWLRQPAPRWRRLRRPTVRTIVFDSLPSDADYVKLNCSTRYIIIWKACIRRVLFRSERH